MSKHHAFAWSHPRAQPCSNALSTAKQLGQIPVDSPVEHVHVQQDTTNSNAWLSNTAVTAVLQQCKALPLPRGDPESVAGVVRQATVQYSLEDSFYVYDLGEVARLHSIWVSAMPRVMPFYAVKCNPDKHLVALLAALGAGFDCASRVELGIPAAYDVPQDNIIFAHPCKHPRDLRYGRDVGVQYTTFDCIAELQKIADIHNEVGCVLRIRFDDPEAATCLGIKYGAELDEVPELLQQAQNLGLQVVGVSFHLGSGSHNGAVYADAIQAARQVFDTAASYGFNMKLLDIGGGIYSPHSSSVLQARRDHTVRLFYKTAETINSALERWFPAADNVRVIAEPGRFFATTAAYFCVPIIGHRGTEGSAVSQVMDYLIADSLVGSLGMNVYIDQVTPEYYLLPATSCGYACPQMTHSQGSSIQSTSSSDGGEEDSGMDLDSDNSTPDSNSQPTSDLTSNTDMGSLLHSKISSRSCVQECLCCSQARCFGQHYPSRIWGSSDRQWDLIEEGMMLPKLQAEDWLMFPAAGAYTDCGATKYGGHDYADRMKLYVFSIEDGSRCQPPDYNV